MDFNNLNNSHISVYPHQPSRPTKQVSLVDTFQLETGFRMKHGEIQKDEQGNPIRKDKLITAFEEAGSLTPAVNDNYVFPKEETIQLLQALSAGETTYLVGHSGTGKTELINQVAARLNYNVLQINFDGHLSRSDLLGDWKIVNGEMVFRYGLIVLGFVTPGTILLLDEIDACPPETAFVLQRALSHDKRFLMHETNQVFALHPQNCVMGTANTAGMGDDSGLYVAGTNIQNFSFLNRWKTVIQVDYISPENEEKVFQKMFAKTPAVPYIPNVVKVLDAVRSAFKGGAMSLPLTTRDGINWLEKIARVPYPMQAARYSFLDKMSVVDATAVAQLIARHFKLKPNDDHKYLTKRS
ncbi:AAA domain-containing protein [bacterium]|nr:AAA domain-containing protein [bacterium]